MRLCWKTFTLCCLVIETGILIVTPITCTEALERERAREQDTIRLFEEWSDPSGEPTVEERGIIKTIKNAWKKVVNRAKELLLDVLLKIMFHNKGLNKCYDGVGCFYYENNMSLRIGGPEAPEKLNATFYFFNNGSVYLEDLLSDNKTEIIPNQTYTLENWTFNSTQDILNTQAPLMVVTHGLTGSKRTPWMKPLVEALLENVNCTVLVVDWEKGAAGTYPDAGVNTPMAGALISLFLQKIVNETNSTIGPDNITLIGFSMGAQVMGFVGRHFRNYTNKTISRISGLDPAGWLYENTNATLTRHDAQYVDVIHTNAGSMKNFRIGLNQSVGHVDFYPNGGTVQTGCKEKPNFIPTDYLDVITCSHYKATRLYIESLRNHTCNFTSYECNSWKDFTSGNCTKHIRENQTGLLGFYSESVPGRGNQFLYTNANSPYCRGNNTKRPEQTRNER